MDCYDCIYSIINMFSSYSIVYHFAITLLNDNDHDTTTTTTTNHNNTNAPTTNNNNINNDT